MVNLRNKVLVTVLDTRKSGLGNSSVVGLLVVLDNRNHLVGSSILTGEEELDTLGGLGGETFEGEDSLGLSVHQLRPSYTKVSKAEDVPMGDLELGVSKNFVELVDLREIEFINSTSSSSSVAKRSSSTTSSASSVEATSTASATTTTGA